MAEKSAESSSPAISLPKGGGAIQGIGETFQPNLFTGTGNFSVPVFTSPGREGFGPKLSLQYSTGNGNGIFGLGWNLSIPRITRKTEKGLPSYTDNDVYVLSGAEDLVPKLKSGNTSVIDSKEVSNGSGSNLVKYRITRYLPRTEGLFSRIESWELLDNTNNHVVDHFWRVTTKENVTSIYGGTTNARIVDPSDGTRVFEWLLEERFDAKGNHIHYEYACDDPQMQIREAYEENRNYAQIYPRRILYANVADQLTDFNGNQFNAGILIQGTDHRNPFSKLDRRYLCEIVFDYGDWKHPINHSGQFVYQPKGNIPEKLGIQIPQRNDPFSTFRPGFELRTLRLCKNVLMIHHFKELGGPTLVKSTDFTYNEAQGSEVSLLTSATVSGYIKESNNKYIHENMPPVEFKYSEFRPEEQKYQTVSAKEGNLPPVSLKDPNTALVDLFGNGLQDIVQTSSAGFRYWRNKGNGQLDQPHSMHQSPSGLTLSDKGVGFADMGGDGLTDLIVQHGPVNGFFELMPEKEVDGQLIGGWSTESFKHLDNQPTIELDDPNLRMLDLTGDGLTDVLITRDHHFLWHQSNGEEGFKEAQATTKPLGLVDLSFNDPFGRIRLADMSGDGLKDIVILHNGGIQYWPNLGYGRFGESITMIGDTNLPLDFNPQRLFLADLDGSGTADLVYVDFNVVNFWFNQSGNSWSEKQTISGTPITIDTAGLSFTDFFGTGTTSLLWSYDFGTFLDGNYKVLDFCGGKKPYLLNEMNNNLGATTKVRYASSTKFYLEDVASGNFWATPLPFPVPVVEKTEAIDHISKSKLVTCYKYHHGYFDGREREFRGFGRVDQIDTEVFEHFEKDDLHDVNFINKNKAHYVPPAETRKWFHTGAYFDHRNILDHYQAEYFCGVEKLDPNQSPQDPKAFSLGENQFELLADKEIIEAHRALRGSVLRTEVYAHDGSADKNFPYLVSEQRYKVQTKQSEGPNPHAVFLATSSDAINYHYERKHNGFNLIDPRIQHNINLEVDEFGNPLKSATISYKRRHANHPEQDKDMVSITCYEYIKLLDTETDFRHSAQVEAQNYEHTGLVRSQDKPYTGTGLDQAFGQAQEISYEEGFDNSQLQKRKLKHQITLFWNNTLTGSLPTGAIGFHGLPFETYLLAFSPGLRQIIYGNRLSLAMGVEAGYRKKSGNNWIPSGQGDWWIPSGRQTFDPGKFYLTTEVADPFNNKISIQYDSYHLFPSRTTDVLDNRQENLINYRVFQPYLIRDINGNHSEAAFQCFGIGCCYCGNGEGRAQPFTILAGNRC